MMADSTVSNETSEKKLTAEQEEFLKCLDEEFKDRYTEADEDYKKAWESEQQTPPILLNFHKISDRNHDNYNRDHRQRRYCPYRDRNNRRGFKRWD